MNCGLRIADCGIEKRSRSARRGGFSFTEVLFAVMILGIGFIMVAAMFPVAIQQAQNSTEETTAAAVGRTAATMLEQVASNSTMPATDGVVVGTEFEALPPLPDQLNYQDTITLSTVLRGSLVAASDSRYAWVPFYRRAGNPRAPSTWSRVAQVIMIPVLSRNESTFNNVLPQVFQRDRQSGGILGTARISAELFDGQNGAPDTIRFQSDLDLMSEGAYVIIADARRRVNAATWAAPQDNWNRNVAPQLQGRIYRLGNPTPTPGVWELMPGFDLEPIRVDQVPGRANDGAQPNPRDGKDTVVPSSSTSFDNVQVFVIGRGLDPNTRTNNPPRVGIAQEAAAYTTFITIRD